MVGPNGSLTITDAQLAAGYVLHVGELEGSFAVGDEITCKVDYGRRAQIAPNHTFTHVLNYALRWVSCSQPATLYFCCHVRSYRTVLRRHQAFPPAL